MNESFYYYKVLKDSTENKYILFCSKNHVLLDKWHIHTMWIKVIIVNK